MSAVRDRVPLHEAMHEPPPWLNPGKPDGVGTIMRCKVDPERVPMSFEQAQRMADERLSNKLIAAGYSPASVEEFMILSPIERQMAFLPRHR